MERFAYVYENDEDTKIEIHPQEEQDINLYPFYIRVFDRSETTYSQ